MCFHPVEADWYHHVNATKMAKCLRFSFLQMGQIHLLLSFKRVIDCPKRISVERSTFIMHYSVWNIKLHVVLIWFNVWKMSGTVSTDSLTLWLFSNCVSSLHLNCLHWNINSGFTLKLYKRASPLAHKVNNTSLAFCVLCRFHQTVKDFPQWRHQLPKQDMVTRCHKVTESSLRSWKKIL